FIAVLRGLYEKSPFPGNPEDGREQGSQTYDANKTHPLPRPLIGAAERESILRDLEFFAAGVVRTADADGAIHAFANDPSSLQETTGTAMVALALHASMRRGWLDHARYAETVQRMWSFCRRHITDDG